MHVRMETELEGYSKMLIALCGQVMYIWRAAGGTYRSYMCATGLWYLTNSQYRKRTSFDSNDTLR